MKRVAVWGGWYVGLLALWLLLVGTLQWVELVAGASAAGIGVAAGAVVWAQGFPRARIDRRWLLRTWRPLARVVPDFLLLLAALAQPSAGTFRRLDFPAGGQRPTDVGRRALVVWAGSLAPNRLVVDVDPDSGQALVHDLVPRVGSPDLP